MHIKDRPEEYCPYCGDLLGYPVKDEEQTDIQDNDAQRTESFDSSDLFRVSVADRIAGILSIAEIIFLFIYFVIAKITLGFQVMPIFLIVLVFALLIGYASSAF